MYKSIQHLCASAFYCASKPLFLTEHVSYNIVGARAWLFVGFVFAFGGLIGSLWILIQEFLVPGQSLNVQ